MAYNGQSKPVTDLEVIVRGVLEDVAVHGVAVLVTFEPVQDLTLQLLVLHVGVLRLVDHFQRLRRVVQTVQAVSFLKNLKENRPGLNRRARMGEPQ